MAGRGARRRIGLLVPLIVVSSMWLTGLPSIGTQAGADSGPVTAAATDTGADVSWAAPGDETVARYQVSAIDTVTGDSFAVLTHGDYTAVHLSQLVDKHQYVITVTSQPAGTVVGTTTVTPQVVQPATAKLASLTASPTTLGTGAPALRLTLGASTAGADADYDMAAAMDAQGTTIVRGLAPTTPTGTSLTLGPLEPNTTYALAANTHTAAGFGPLTWITATTGASACPAGACLSLTRSSQAFSPRVNGVLNDVGQQGSSFDRISAMRPAVVRANAGYGNSPAVGQNIKQLATPFIENLSDAWFNRTDSGSVGGAMPPWECWDCYESFIRSQVTSILANGLHPTYWEVANEPGANGYYPPHLMGDAGLYLEQLERAAAAIRDVDPSARILTPTIGQFALGSATALNAAYLPLDLVLANASLIPGFAGLDWHEISGGAAPAIAANDITMAKQVAILAGYPDLAIVVSEYTTPQDAPLAGAGATWMGWLSDAGVSLASRSCWENEPGLGSANSTCEGMADGLLTDAGQLTGPGEAATFYGALGTDNADNMTVASSSPYVSATSTTDDNGVTRILVGYEASCLPVKNPACPAGSPASPGPTTVRITAPMDSPSVHAQTRIIDAAPGPSHETAGTTTLPVSAHRVVTTVPLNDGTAAEITLTPRSTAVPAPSKQHHRVHHRHHHRGRHHAKRHHQPRRHRHHHHHR